MFSCSSLSVMGYDITSIQDIYFAIICDTVDLDPVVSVQNKKSQVTSNALTSVNGEGRAGPQFNLFTAQHEVQRFGIQGLDRKSKEEATVDLLVSLGAKVINY